MLILREGLFFNEQEEEDRRRSKRANFEICFYCYLTTVAVFADGHKIETMVGMLFGFPRRVEEKNLSFDVSVFVISIWGISTGGWLRSAVSPTKIEFISSISLNYLLSLLGWQPVVAINRALKL